MFQAKKILSRGEAIFQRSLLLDLRALPAELFTQPSFSAFYEFVFIRLPGLP
jgi:hypothetical protein